MESKPIIIRQARRLLMRNLERTYPSGLTVKYLYQTACTVDEGYGFDLMRKDLSYLLEKGYIKLVGFGGKARIADIHNEESLVVVKLTASGLEIAQGLIEDRAMEINFDA
jgi:hypothetical protein